MLALCLNVEDFKTVVTNGKIRVGIKVTELNNDFDEAKKHGEEVSASSASMRVAI